MEITRLWAFPLIGGERDNPVGAASSEPELLNERPGFSSQTLERHGGVAPTQIRVFRFRRAYTSLVKSIETKSCISERPDYDELQALRSQKSEDLWLQIKGLADLPAIESTLSAAGIESRNMPFLISNPQVNQVILNNSELLATLHHLSIEINRGMRLESMQFCLLLKPGLLISVEEDPHKKAYERVENMVREKIQQCTNK